MGFSIRSIPGNQVLRYLVEHMRRSSHSWLSTDRPLKLYRQASARCPTFVADMMTKPTSEADVGLNFSRQRLRRLDRAGRRCARRLRRVTSYPLLSHGLKAVHANLPLHADDGSFGRLQQGERTEKCQRQPDQG